MRLLFPQGMAHPNVLGLVGECPVSLRKPRQSAASQFTVKCADILSNMKSSRPRVCSFNALCRVPQAQDSHRTTVGVGRVKSLGAESARPPP